MSDKGLIKSDRALNLNELRFCGRFVNVLYCRITELYGRVALQSLHKVAKVGLIKLSCERRHINYPKLQSGKDSDCEIKVMDLRTIYPPPPPPPLIGGSNVSSRR